MNKVILTFFSLMILVLSCSKQGTVPENVEQTTIEVPKMMFVTTFSGQNTVLTCFNMDKTIKWKVELDGFADGMQPNYENGIVCLRTGYYAGNPDGSYVAYSNFFVLDANTGSELWSITKSKEYLRGPVMQDGVIYCSVMEPTANSIAAFDAKTGARLWKYYSDAPYPASYLHAEGNILYFGNSTSNYNSNLNAFDITSKRILWKAPLGVIISNPYSNPIITSSAIYMKNGTGSMLGINKQSGTIAWQQAGPDFGQPAYGSNMVFSYKLYEGLFAMNATDGTVSWQKKEYGTVFNPPYFASGNLYIVSNRGNTSIVSAMAPATGDIVWETALDPVKFQSRYLNELVVVGDNLYANVLNANDPNALVTKYLIFDAHSGALKDSLQISGSKISNIGIVTTSDHYYGPNWF